MKATSCLFFTTLYKETQGTFVALNVTFALKNLEGWNSAFEEDMPWKPPIKHMRAKTSDRKHAVRSCYHSRIVLSPCTRNRRTFPANWQVDIYTFWHFIKTQVGGRGSWKKFLQVRSLPSFLALVLPHFFSCSPFLLFPATESLEQASVQHIEHLSDSLQLRWMFSWRISLCFASFRFKAK